MTANLVVMEGMVLEAVAFSHTPAGTKVAQFQIQHQAPVADLPPLERLSCRLTVVALGILADDCRNLEPGTPVRIEGCLNQKRWMRGGQERWGALELVARTIQPLPESPA